MIGIVAGLSPLVPALVEGAQITVGSVTGKRGWIVTVPVSLDPGSAPVSATQNDITYDSVRTPIVTKIDGTPDCIVNPSLGKDASFAFHPPGCTGAECMTVRAAVYKLEEASPSIPGGSLYSCNVKIATTAPTGTYALLNSEARSSRSNGNEISTTAGNGQVTVQSGGPQCSIDPHPQRSAFSATLLLALLLALRSRRRRGYGGSSLRRAAALGAVAALAVVLPVAASATAAPVRLQGTWGGDPAPAGGTWDIELGLDAAGELSGHLTLDGLPSLEQANVVGFLYPPHVLLILYAVDGSGRLGELAGSLNGAAFDGTLRVGQTAYRAAGDWRATVEPAPVPQAILDGLAAGQPQDVIVKFDDREITAEAAAMRASAGLTADDAATRAFKATRFAALKSDVLGRVRRDRVAVLRDYSHLPTMFVRVESEDGLAELLAQPGVARVHENVVYERQVMQSLSLIGQPAAFAAGFSGNGTTVAVLDTGVNPFSDAGPGNPPGLPVFGSCGTWSQPLFGAPGCSIAFAADFTPGHVDSQFDDGLRHGTHVAGTVIGVAPGARIAALDVFRGDGAFFSDIAAAINWTIANRDAYNVVAINMSIGAGFGSTQFPTVCPNSDLIEEVALARAAGIASVISSGNVAQPFQISMPACTPGAVRVGAVYDSNLGPQSFPLTCTDASTAADQVACFSNSAAVLTALAPGCEITVAGDTKCGTSMAAPHVAGGAALLRTGPFANDSVDCVVARIKQSGAEVLDHRNGMHFPRLDVAAAVATRPSSVGDCAAVDGFVRIHEVMRGVAIFHGTRPLSACRAMDADGNGAVSIDELVTAVKIMMTGCAAGASGNP